MKTNQTTEAHSDAYDDLMPYFSDKFSRLLTETADLSREHIVTALAHATATWAADYDKFLAAEATCSA